MSLECGLRSRMVALAAALAAAGPAAGCSQPGVQAPRAEAASLGDATTAISAACGYAEELTAFAHDHPEGMAAVAAMARSAARELASVLARDRSRIYQGETVRQVARDAASLLGDCGLAGARDELRRALAAER